MGLYLVLPLAIVIAVFFWRVHDSHRRASFLSGAALVLTGVVAFLVGAFVIGETLDDPGGWRAVGLIAVWLVPLLILVALAWWRATWMVVPLGLLSLVPLALAAWCALDPSWWRAYEDQAGPLRTIAMFVVATAIAVFGRSRPATGGVLLLVCTSLPMLLTQLALGGPVAALGTSLVTLASPYVVIALLYLGSAAITHADRPAPRNGVPRGA